VFVLLSSAVLYGAPAAAAPLQLLSPGPPSVSIALSVQPKPTKHGRKSAPRHTYVWLTGTSNIPLENGTGKPVSIDALFFAAESKSSEAVTKTSSLLEVSKPLRIAAGGTGVLHLNASLLSDQQPSDLDGTLMIESRDSSGKRLGSLDLTVTGALQIPTDIVFEPSEVTLQVTRWQGVPFRTVGDHLHVRVRGPGVDKLVATVGALAQSQKTAQPAATVLLGSDNGNQTLVELGDLKLIQPGLAEATITTEESVACVNGGAVECGHGPPSPGSYSGTLTLNGVGGGPTLKVTVNSRFWFLFPVLLVLLGAVLGGLLPLLAANAQTKRELRESVTAELADYKGVSAHDGTAAAWDIADSLGEEAKWYDKHYVGPPGDTTVAAVWTNIHTARSSNDLKQASTAVSELTGRVEAWIAAAPLAAGLEKLQANAPPDRGGKSFQDTQVCQDTDVLLYVVHDVASPSADEAANLAERLRRQCRFHEEYINAWKRRAHLEGLEFSEDEKREAANLWGRADLDKFDERVAAVGEADRTDQQQAQLEVGLARVVDAIERLIQSGEKGVPAEEVELAVSPEEKVRVVEQLTDRGRTPAEVAQLMGVERTTVEEIQSALPQTTAATAPRAQHQPPKRTPRVRRSGFLDHLRGATDIILTVLIAGLTAVVYMIPLYTSTWGGWQDWLAAFGAGVAGQVGIKWAVLPALRSKHLPALDDAGSGGSS
jgi:hypothetical protein